jgi:hypothetical protein
VVEINPCNLRRAAGIEKIKDQIAEGTERLKCWQKQSYSRRACQDRWEPLWSNKVVSFFLGKASDGVEGRHSFVNGGS